METIENIEKAIDNIIAVVSLQHETLKEIKLLLSSEALKGINLNANFLIQELKVPVRTGDSFEIKHYKGYPINDSFPQKMEFLDNIHPQAWRLKERRDLIIAIEGPVESAKTLDGVTGKLQNLWKSGKWVGAKYGSVNKCTFYVRKEWITVDGKSIKSEFAPPAEMLSVLSEEQKKPENIKWLKNNKY